MSRVIRALELRRSPNFSWALFFVPLCLSVSLILPLDAAAQTQNKGQQTCINTQNKSAQKLAQTQGKENASCIKDAGKDKLGVLSADDCLTADRKQKVSKASQKLIDLELKKCGSPLPTFGFETATVIDAAAIGEELALTGDVFGPTLNTVVLAGSDESSCQASLSKSYEKLGATVLKSFNKCKKLGLKDGVINSLPTLEACYGDTSDGKIDKARSKVLTTVQKKCVGVDMAAAFPGNCAGVGGDENAFSDCINESTLCRMCLAANEFDDMAVPCDLRDNGALDGSCRQCGNSVTEAPEDCDDGGESATCNADCTTATCGDGQTNPTAGEQCDDANASDNDTCPTTCLIAVCGDTFTCNGVACTSGPGGGLEECDDGGANSDVTPDACRTDCALPSCGDGVTDTGEDCDDSGESATCNADCTTAVCGDGQTNTTAGEQCDDANGSANDACVACQDATCGDGNLCSDGTCTTGPGGGTEECDDGGANSDVTPDACRTNCSNPACGDGVTDAGEQCDDAGESATCNADCTTATCGDGKTNASAAETCDDGNAVDNDTCPTNCLTATCGDGFSCTLGGCTSGPGGGIEECDDGGSNSDVTPDACRTDCAAPTCGDGVADSGEICDDAGDSAVCDSDCTAVVCGDGLTNGVAGEECDGAGETAGCDTDCTDAECGDDTLNVTAGEECDDGNLIPGDGCNASCACGGGSGEVGCQDSQCPNLGELTIFAATTGIVCVDNNDCAVGTCDNGLGVCTTQSELDTGWTGISHNADINDQVLTIGNLVCPGPFNALDPEPCGECTVIGLNPATGDCRCANNTRTVCDEPFVADSDDCGGAICDCYFGAPLPLSAGNTPACVVNRFANDVSGTANVDLGSGTISANLSSRVYTSTNQLHPCPTCGGTCTAPPANVGNPCGLDLDCDTVIGDASGTCSNYDPIIGDGVRGGTCHRGISAGLPCDIGAINESFPAPGGSGAGMSLDCLPNTGTNVSGTGLKIGLVQTTGTSALPVAAIPCPFFGIPYVCPCGECSDGSTPCSSNADCVGPDTCLPVGAGGTSPRPNFCGDDICTDMGGGEGLCLGNASDKFCNGVVRADGKGFLQCNSNADCASLGSFTGDCLLTSPRSCFLDPVTATGTPNPTAPFGVSSFCVADTSSPAINSVAGLPGPARVRNQTSSTLYCASDPGTVYIPGTGGCP